MFKFKFLKSLFVGPENTGKVLDSLIATGDALVYTSEEKAQAAQKYDEWYLKYQEATLPQNRARRLVAVIITGLFAYLTVMTSLVWLLSTDYAAFLLMLLQTVVAAPFVLITGFYFYKRRGESNA